jgi:Zn-dependent protease with chaperone function
MRYFGACLALAMAFCMPVRAHAQDLCGLVNNFTGFVELYPAQQAEKDMVSELMTTAGIEKSTVLVCRSAGQVNKNPFPESLLLTTGSIVAIIFFPDETLVNISWGSVRAMAAHELGHVSRRIAGDMQAQFVTSEAELQNEMQADEFGARLVGKAASIKALEESLDYKKQTVRPSAYESVRRPYELRRSALERLDIP